MGPELRERTLEQFRRESILQVIGNQNKELVFDFNLYDIKIEQLMMKKSESVYMYISIQDNSQSGSQTKREEEGPDYSSGLKSSKTLSIPI